MVQCRLRHQYLHYLYSVSYFAGGIGSDARSWEVVGADEVGGVAVGETTGTGIVVVAAAAAVAGDSRRQKGNLGYAAGRNLRVSVVELNFVSCDDLEDLAQDNLEQCSLEEGRM